MSAKPAVLVESRPLADLRPHEHAQLPPLDERIRTALCDDIRARGIVEPIEITADGTVLNGRERLAAAKQLGLEELPVRIVAPADEVEHIILAALQRRHLTASQRAARSRSSSTATASSNKRRKSDSART
jgi:ParB-like chromosome segregation protein Spo0J